MHEFSVGKSLTEFQHAFFRAQQWVRVAFAAVTFAVVRPGGDPYLWVWLVLAATMTAHAAYAIRSDRFMPRSSIAIDAVFLISADYLFTSYEMIGLSFAWLAVVMPKLLTIRQLRLAAVPMLATLGHLLWRIANGYRLVDPLHGDTFEGVASVVSILIPIAVLSLLVTRSLVKATEAQEETARSFETLFASLPVPAWVADFSEAYRDLAEKGQTTADQVEKHLNEHPGEAHRLAVERVVARAGNAALFRLMGVTDEAEFVGPYQEEFLGPIFDESFRTDLVGLLRDRDVGPFPIKMNTPGGLRSGNLRLFDASGTGEPDFSRVIVAFVDTTTRDQLEALTTLEIALKDSILDVDTAEELARRVSEVTVSTGDFPLAWVGLHNEETGATDPIAWAGTLKELVPMPGAVPLGIRLSGPTARAVNSGEPVIINDVRDHPNMVANRESVGVTVKGSVASIPFNSRGVRGALCVHGTQAGAFDSPTLDLLARVADAVASGLADIKAMEEVRLANEALEEEIKSKDQFSVSIAHELRTPLTTVLGIIQELHDAPTEFGDEERHALLDLVLRQAGDLAALIDDLMVMGRTDETISVHPTVMDLRAEVEGVAGLVDADTEIVDGPPVTAYADPVRVRQIVRNLLTNAARHGGTGIQLVVGDGDHPWVEVRDDGQGVPADLVETIFQPYRSASATNRHPYSVGLGLTISRRLALLMGGTLSYRRDDGVTVFRLDLPNPDGIGR